MESGNLGWRAGPIAMHRSVDVVSRGCRPDPSLKTGLYQHVSTVACCLFKTALMPVGPFATLAISILEISVLQGQTSHQRFAAHQNNWWLNDWRCFFPHSELGWVSNGTWITISDFWLDVHPSQYDRLITQMHNGFFLSWVNSETFFATSQISLQDTSFQTESIAARENGTN